MGLFHESKSINRAYNEVQLRSYRREEELKVALPALISIKKQL
ncbi:hypothetical protein BMWSH_2186 [Priestia megaterium WSH-002]|nr:hypothetical protein BMWSH_2186 [Priestia megaterium WSH-002]